MLITILLLLACAVLAAASVPLILKLVPPNPIFGVRTERAMDNPEIWYPVNVYGGKALLIASGVAALVLIMYQGTWLRSGWLQIIAFLIPIVVAVVVTLRFEKGYGRR